MEMKVVPSGLSLAVLIAVVPFLVGCPESEEVFGSCRTDQLDDGSIICVDYLSSHIADTFRQSCETAMRGVWSDGPCDTGGVLGGCRSGDRYSITWIYLSRTHTTVNDVMEYCERRGGTFVPPQ
jgi:hypothetical protein